MPHFVRSPFNYNRDEASLDSSIHFDPDRRPEDIHRTVQSSKDETDINVIVRNFGVTGQLPQGARLPSYGDFTGVFDYQSARNAIMEADAAFMKLPAEVRAEFDNDPQQLLAATEDPSQYEKLVKLGLAKKKETGDTTNAVNPVGENDGKAGVGSSADVSAQASGGSGSSSSSKQ